MGIYPAIGKLEGESFMGDKKNTTNPNVKKKKNYIDFLINS